MPDLMKIAFPVLTLPVDRGGRRAVLVFTASLPTQPGLLFATCMDTAGQFHQNVPFTRAEIMAAASQPVTFMEAPQERAPTMGGTGLVSPDGRAL